MKRVYAYTRECPAGVREIPLAENTCARVYESLSHYLDTEVLPLHAKRWRGGSWRPHTWTDREWDANVTVDQAVQRGRLGDPGVTDRVQALVTDIRTGIEPAERKTWRRDVMGSRVVVPDYLAGSPYCMRRRARDTRQARHVRIYVDTCCDASIDAEDMLARGAAILALLETLQSTGIEVDVFALCSVDAVQVVPLPSRPLDVSQVGFVLAHPAWSRHVMYGVEGMYGRFTGGFAPISYGGQAGLARLEAAFRKAMDLNDTDIFLPRLMRDDPCMNDPKGWIERQLARLAA